MDFYYRRRDLSGKFYTTAPKPHTPFKAKAIAGFGRNGRRNYELSQW
jgi:hypothetical protein